MKVILTMAGFGSRFRDAGYDQEKYDIEYRGHTLLEWSLASLAQFRPYETIFIARRVEGVTDSVLHAADRLGFDSRSLILLDAPTSGQAETVCMARCRFEEDDSILIFNTDTFVDPDHVSPSDIRGDGWAPTFAAAGDKWSFFEANESGLVKRSAEKVRISDHCSVGMYYFSSFWEFHRLASNAQAIGELFVAPIYNDWIAAGHLTYIHELPAGSVTVLGTPEDLGSAELSNQPQWPSRWYGEG